MSTLKVDTIASDTTPTITISDGLSVTGVTTSTGNINISNDTGRLRIGAGADLQSWHNGTNSFIKNTTGRLDITSTSYLYLESDARTYIGDVGMNEPQAIFIADGAVELFHDGNKKFETTSTGINLTDQLTVQGNINPVQHIKLPDNKKTIYGTGEDFDIYHTGSNSFFENKTGNVYFRNDGSTTYFQMGTSDESGIAISKDGPVELYYDNTKKAATHASGFKIWSGNLLLDRDAASIVIGAGDDLSIHHTSGVNHIRSANGNVVIGTDGNNMVILGAYYNAGGGGDTVEVWGGANFVPATNDAIDLGETNHKWDDIYATNGTIQTSDQNNKDNIATSDLGLSFIDKLSPKSYKFKGKTRTHYGLIAQDVETVLSDISKATSDFAGFIKTDAPVQLYNERDEAQNRIPSGKAIGDVKLAAHTDYGLRYGEFIGPLIKAVQELSAKVTALESA